MALLALSTLCKLITLGLGKDGDGDNRGPLAVNVAVSVALLVWGAIEVIA